ncbi:MAG: MFS transporter [Chloroflexi bacterium]|nr:MAG: MFS transporter [Chloroflexota bacterium]
MSSPMKRGSRSSMRLIVVMLAVEFLDELIFGAREAAWPLIRTDLSLTYGQIGLILSVPMFVANFIEPVIGILGDVWRRHLLILGGGLVVAASLLLFAAGQNFAAMMAATFLVGPASGAFVNLSQATLMDSEPTRHEQNMARWAFAGSLGIVAGPLVLSAFVAVHLGWRGVFVFFAVLTMLTVGAVWWIAARDDTPLGTDGNGSDFMNGLRSAYDALRRRDVLRWLTLLQFSDLMLDGLHGYLALYFVDVVGVDAVQGGLAVAVWTGVGLVGDFLMIPLLERVRGLAYLRYSVLAELILFPIFLLVPGLMPKLVVLGLVGFFNAGWYSILQGHLYSAMPGQSGTVMAVNNVGGLFGSLIPLLIGLAAGQFGLDVAIWLLITGPIVLLVGLPSSSDAKPHVPE